MTDFAPSLPFVKAIGDFINNSFTGRNNIREAFLLEWGLKSLVGATESDPAEPKLRNQRMMEANESLEEVAKLLAKELGLSDSMTMRLIKSGHMLREGSSWQGTVQEYIRKSFAKEVNTFNGRSERGEAFIQICTALVSLEANKPIQIVMDHVAQAHFALSPDKKGREYDFGRVSGSMLNEVKGLQSKATMREIKAQEQRDFEDSLATR